MTSMFASLRQALEADPAASLRTEQRPPDGDWTVWLFCAGRGVGKNHTGSCWTNAIASRACRIALVSPTAADVRDVMVLGPSGIVALAPEWNRPVFEPSRRRLTWPSGAEAMLFSAEEPDRLRGPQFHYAWVDEICAARDPRNMWNMLMMGLRLGQHPRVFVSTTPRPIPLLRELIARDGKDVVLTRGRTADNSANLAPTFLSTITKQYEGTRLGRQELEGELLEDVPGALWSRAMLDQARIAPDAMPAMRRVVVAVDPSGARGQDDENADSIGIIVAGKGVDGRGYILEDCPARTVRPAGAAR